VKGRNYRTPKGRPYTRRKYIRGFPQPKITKFTMGNTAGDYDHQVSLVAQKEVQVRHNALEATRMAVNRVLELELPGNYRMCVLPYPHQILRENKMINVAQADRFQEGMRGAFGKPTGTAARVRADQPVVTVDVAESGLDAAKRALMLGRAKLPMPCRITVERLQPA